MSCFTIAINNLVTYKFSYKLDRQNKSSIFLFVFLLVLIALKSGSNFITEPLGFRACYSSTIGKSPEKFEFSASNFFNTKYTRIDKLINFNNQTWNFGFWNDLRFNIYQWENGNYIIGRYPFTVSWTAAIDPTEYDFIEISLWGNLKIKTTFTEISPIKDRQTNKKYLIKIPIQDLIPSYQLINNTTKPPDLPIEITYTYDTNSRIGDSPETYSPFPELRIIGIKSNSYVEFRPKTPNKNLGLFVASIFYTLFMLTVLFFSLFYMCLSVYKKNKTLFVVLASFAALFFFSLSPIRELNTITFLRNIFLDSYSRIFVLLLLGLLVGFFRHTNLDLSFILYFMFFTQLLPIAFINLETVHYRIPGDDMLTYESFSRSILISLSSGSFFEAFRGCESAFHYQPFFRYFLAMMHLIFGDGNPGIVIFTKYLFFIAVVFLYKSFLRPNNNYIMAIIFIFFFIGYLEVFIFPNIDMGLSDHLAFLFLLLAFPYIYTGQQSKLIIFSCVLLGFSSISRINGLPACFLMIVIFIYKSWLHRNSNPIQTIGLKTKLANYKTYIGGLTFFILIYSFVPLHNFVYTKNLILTTTAASIPENLEIHPLKYISFPYSIEFKQTIINRIKAMINYNKGNYQQEGLKTILNFTFFSNFIVFLYFSILFIEFFRLIFYVFNRQYCRRSTYPSHQICDLFFIMTPLFFIIPHFFYQITVYYPRHIVSFHLTIYCIIAFIIIQKLGNLKNIKNFFRII